MACSRVIHRYAFTRMIWQRALGIITVIWLALQSAWLYLCPRNKYVNGVHQYVKKNIGKHQSTLSFLKAWILNPRATGAILPSSERLANTMTSYIIQTEHSIVVELGAGTGVITEAIFRAGVLPAQLVAIEYSRPLAKKLQERFPEMRVIEGNAAHLLQLLKNLPKPVSTIISGLPLRSLPEEVRVAILEQIPKALAPNGRFIQFTYDLRETGGYYPKHYYLAETTIIWRNIPPAKVEVFTFAFYSADNGRISP